MTDLLQSLIFFFRFTHLQKKIYNESKNLVISFKCMNIFVVQMNLLHHYFVGGYHRFTKNFLYISISNIKNLLSLVMPPATAHYSHEMNYSFSSQGQVELVNTRHRIVSCPEIEPKTSSV